LVVHRVYGGPGVVRSPLLRRAGNVLNAGSSRELARMLAQAFS